MYARIIDANINRIAEGLRVIEEFVRFELSDENLAKKLAFLRHQANSLEMQKTENLMGRDTSKDARATHSPTKRKSVTEVLIANFKRVQEALRVLEEYTGNETYNKMRYELYELEKEIVLKSQKPTIENGVYLISDNPQILREGLKKGVSLIQLRGKTESKESIYNKAKELAIEAKKAGIPFIVNDYLDIAKAVDSDGVHTGQDDLDIEIQREILGHHKILGRTTHTLEQGIKAQSQGADYISVGPIWETPSKPGRAGIGFEYLSKMKEKIQIPYVAIGGINRKNLDEVLVYGPSLIGFIRDHEGIEEIQARLKQSFAESK